MCVWVCVYVCENVHKLYFINAIITIRDCVIKCFLIFFVDLRTLMCVWVCVRMFINCISSMRLLLYVIVCD